MPKRKLTCQGFTVEYGRSHHSHPDVKFEINLDGGLGCYSLEIPFLAQHRLTEDGIAVKIGKLVRRAYFEAVAVGESKAKAEMRKVLGLS